MRMVNIFRILMVEKFCPKQFKVTNNIPLICKSKNVFSTTCILVLKTHLAFVLYTYRIFKFLIKFLFNR